MKPWQDSIQTEALKPISVGDHVVFRLVNKEHFSGVIESMSSNRDAFTFVGRGIRIHAVEIASIEEHIPVKAR